MKENKEVADTNVVDIEEALEKLSTGKKIKMYELLRTFKREGIENFVITRKKYVDVILSDYKRVLKENEELKQDRNNNYQMIALAQNEALGYMQGYADGKKLRRSAVANIVESQQYYILKKQIEHYKEHIVKLQKENERLKKQVEYDKTHIYTPRTIELNYVSKQKIKDKIEELNNRIEKYREYVEQGIATNVEWVDNVADRETVKVLQELIEGRK